VETDSAHVRSRDPQEEAGSISMRAYPIGGHHGRGHVQIHRRDALSVEGGGITRARCGIICQQDPGQGAALTFSSGANERHGKRRAS